MQYKECSNSLERALLIFIYFKMIHVLRVVLCLSTPGRDWTHYEAWFEGVGGAFFVVVDFLFFVDCFSTLSLPGSIDKVSTLFR